MTRIRKQHAAAHALRLNAISRELRLCFRTVQRYAQAVTAEDLLVGFLGRTSNLDAFTEHIHQRWNAGCTNTPDLHAELRALSWRGSLQTLYRYVRPLRAQGKAPDPKPSAPKPRHVTRWIMTNPKNLKAGDAVRLKDILFRCPELEAASRHVGDFAAMMLDLRGDRVDDWMDRVQADDLPALHSLVTGLRRDQVAVTNGLTLSWSSGACEGEVNRVKALKRAMSGRANLDLLRLRILLPN